MRKLSNSSCWTRAISSELALHLGLQYQLSVIWCFRLSWSCSWIRLRMSQLRILTDPRINLNLAALIYVRFRWLASQKSHCTMTAVECFNDGRRRCSKCLAPETAWFYWWHFYSTWGLDWRQYWLILCSTSSQTYEGVYRFSHWFCCALQLKDELMSGLQSFFAWPLSRAYRRLISRFRSCLSPGRVASPSSLCSLQLDVLQLLRTSRLLEGGSLPRKPSHFKLQRVLACSYFLCFRWFLH